MNNRGQAILTGIMIFVMVFLALVTFIDPIKDQVTSTRSSGNLDCANGSISAGNKALCILVDFSPFYFFGMGLAAAAAYLGGRLMFKNINK